VIRISYDVVNETVFAKNMQDTASHSVEITPMALRVAFLHNLQEEFNRSESLIFSDKCLDSKRSQLLFE
jgi:hypothetical protein